MSSPPALSRNSSGDTFISDQTTTSGSSGPSTSSSSGSKPRSHHTRSRRLTAQPPPLKRLAAKASVVSKRWQPLPAVHREAVQRALQSPTKDVPICPACRRQGCRLRSHQNLVVGTRKQGNAIVADPGLILTTDEAYKNSYAYHLARAYVDPGLSQGRIDPFHNLPLSVELDTAQNHFLLHYYFSYETKQGLQLPRVPDLPDDLILSPFFVVAMRDPAVCLSVLALATAVFPTNQALPPDEVGALEYTEQAMSLVREATTAGDPPSDEVIVSQVFLWATSMITLKKKDMRVYADSVHSLVRARGGLQNLGFQGKIEQFIRWIEIRYGLVAHVACKYQDVPDSPATLLMKCPPKYYGSFWETESAAKILSPEVLESCLNVCRKIEITEETFVTGITMSTLWWLMGKILSFGISRTRVLEMYDSTNTLNECVILANELALHFALDDVVKQRNAVICQTEPLVRAMQEIDRHFPQFLDGSHGETELLIWILFMVLMIPHEFAGKEWARAQLCRVIRGSIVEDGVMPSDWSVQLWRSFAQFSWSNLKIRKFFDDVCSEISHEVLLENEHD